MPLISYWPLDEASGSAVDYAGTNGGTLVNGVTQGSVGVLGNTSYSFDKSQNQYVEAGSSGIPTGNSPRSVSLWYYTTSTSRQSLVAAGGNGTTDGSFDVETSAYNAGAVNNSLGIHTWGGYATTGANTAITNEWVHLVITFSGGASNDSNIDIYRNGENLPVVYSSGSINTSLNTVEIGMNKENGANNIATEGRICEVRVYDHALTPSEVQYLYDVSVVGEQTSGKKTL